VDEIKIRTYAGPAPCAGKTIRSSNHGPKQSPFYLPAPLRPATTVFPLHPSWLCSGPALLTALQVLHHGALRVWLRSGEGRGEEAAVKAVNGRPRRPGRAEGPGRTTEPWWRGAAVNVAVLLRPKPGQAFNHMHFFDRTSAGVGRSGNISTWMSHVGERGCRGDDLFAPFCRVMLGWPAPRHGAPLSVAVRSGPATPRHATPRHATQPSGWPGRAGPPLIDSDIDGLAPDEEGGGHTVWELIGDLNAGAGGSGREGSG
jgi:hypothetical protein